MNKDNFYGINIRTIDGNLIKMEQFRGDFLLIVNTASKCGLTPQYEGLEALHKKYEEDGFKVLGFPSNDFLKQEPGTEEDIKSFCQLNYNVSFPLFSKINVNGKETHPLYVYLKNNARGFLAKRIKWNFTKFLVDRNGNVIKRYAPSTRPERIENDIRKLLGK